MSFQAAAGSYPVYAQTDEVDFYHVNVINWRKAKELCDYGDSWIWSYLVISLGSKKTRKDNEGLSKRSRSNGLMALMEGKDFSSLALEEISWREEVEFRQWLIEVDDVEVAVSDHIKAITIGARVLQCDWVKLRSRGGGGGQRSNWSEVAYVNIGTTIY